MRFEWFSFAIVKMWKKDLPDLLNIKTEMAEVSEWEEVETN